MAGVLSNAMVGGGVRPRFRSCAKLRSCSGCRRAAADRRAGVSVRAGLFDMFKESPEEKARKEAEFQQQQEVLARRRSGQWKQDVEARRANVTRYNTDEDYKKQVDEEKRARAPKQEDPPLGSIIIPLAPFGMPEYDLGERFDLKGPYVDNGWVDEEADVMGKLGNMFGGGKKNKKIEEADTEGGK
uniref:Uncharacterized protein n=1 Tax=Tetraselmis chuii TaxID=63592 RepID=A0A7S1WYS6_9CHLO|mmetsp:Transcript_11444/g.20699  ORF Transcript_11444/g.20699 Transcript_11444/m.20699 type:complete len:186 (+) Transcript_11444:129-686(+)|eukprot:CAMPEP_0177754362 /NCGR_PEP_ID=MMETSP0491_2-20121128/1970_1 /TAXON_ID=63592 /ORGANISM="Tetraselmis chuii, Strain PLY429" /LENGTH=185 /DNA_ID=CAMNT_0019269743 /DNA_START=121 /DNA_END=678 /DNA_ORIENTATION=-